MKGFGFWVLLFMVGTALLCLSFSSKTISSSVTDMAFDQNEKDVTVTVTGRKLKDHGYSRRSENSDAGNINLEDYRPIDPVPSSKATIRPGPIQHGSPLMPYIPKPTPPAPGHPKRGGFP